MKIVHTASEPIKPHYCSTWPSPPPPVGSVIQCEDCGRYWYRSGIYNDDMHYPWLPVRWWHWRIRQRIAESA